MLRLFGPNCSTEPVDPADTDALPESAVWIDLCNPTREEEKLAEKLLSQNIPTREEMLEIEPSSRLYQRDGSTVMTMSVLHGVDEDCPDINPVSFILTDRHLVTLRYVDPTPFRAFVDHARLDVSLTDNSIDTLIGLMDAVVDSLADREEEVGIELEKISKQIFTNEPQEKRRSPELRYEALMLRIGAIQRLLAKVREASVSSNRLVGYLNATDRIDTNSHQARHLRSLTGDLRALNDHSDFLSENLNFLLDASLGMINLQQNRVMKIFSVVAVVLMPPTLIAGIYGMNFDYMPELRNHWGYLWSIAAMLASAIIPYWVARRKGWL
jgi:magnesium transporter